MQCWSQFLLLIREMHKVKNEALLNIYLTLIFFWLMLSEENAVDKECEAHV